MQFLSAGAIMDMQVTEEGMINEDTDIELCAKSGQ